MFPIGARECALRLCPFCGQGCGYFFIVKDSRPIHLEPRSTCNGFMLSRHLQSIECSENMLIAHVCPIGIVETRNNSVVLSYKQEKAQNMVYASIIVDKSK